MHEVLVQRVLLAQPETQLRRRRMISLAPRAVFSVFCGVFVKRKDETRKDNSISSPRHEASQATCANIRGLSLYLHNNHQHSTTRARLHTPHML